MELEYNVKESESMSLGKGSPKWTNGLTSSVGKKNNSPTTSSLTTAKTTATNFLEFVSIGNILKQIAVDEKTSGHTKVQFTEEFRKFRKPRISSNIVLANSRDMEAFTYAVRIYFYSQQTF